MAHTAFSQELPPINTFVTESYKAESQNWSISQANNKFVYLANNKGLLEFNGAVWKLYPTPNETIMRSVKAVNNTIYTGFYMDFGYWDKDEFGNLNYTSIVDKYNIDVLEDEQFWNIITADDWIIFQSLQNIYLFNSKNNQIKIINSETNISKIFKIDGSIYFHQVNKGIFIIEQGKPKLVWDFKEMLNSVINIFKHNNGFLVFTDNNGAYIIQDNEIKEWESPINKTLKNQSVYSIAKLSNNNYMIGTIANGAYYCSNNGVIQFNLNKKNGLNNNTVLAVFEDQNKNVWLGLDNGLGVININAPYKIYKDLDGNLGTVYTSILFKNYLYLGTNQGVFYRKLNTNDTFSFIQGSEGQVWKLKIIDDTLFCGHNSGTFIITNNKLSKIVNQQGTWDFKIVNDSTLLQGNYNGIHLFKKSNEQWRYSHKIDGFNISSRYFEYLKPNKIIVNHEYKGIFSIDVDKNLTHATKVVIDTSVNKSLHSSLLKYQNNILYAEKKGVYRYIENENTFKKDSLFSKLIPKSNYASGKLVNDNNTKIWSFCTNNINYLTPGNLSDNYQINSVHIAGNLIKKPLGFENITPIGNQNYLIGGLDGYLLLNLDKITNKQQFNIQLNSVKKSNLDNNQTLLNLHQQNPTINHTNNNISFYYSVPYFQKGLLIQYQYYLENHSKTWSDWSNSSETTFENLPFGNYIFKVRARVGNTITQNTETYTFSIARPWYLSNLLIVLYVLMIALFSVFMHNFYKRLYAEQREKLLEKQKKDFEIKTLANEKELMKIKNNQLKADVDSKNRELAISTMSIIKKNEFLSAIKNELKNGDEDSIKKVVKIINKNLTNTDDWKMFKEAFNNADKDFINKIKSVHPTLTPNDLRLCAYLRLNLSSKEIAPLLNISPKSVEVKRYRLRKKMNLPHDQNLTNYILEI
ncbi:helix-turn-helix and ligand-binding sensor domain-containing protein [Tenacibaculum geojense]|uniref:Triple tyrosine motif-containing protein n=1 Tax=Tenacibaculum geojense TaxID=915352 RepID=A0ABW3JNJ2_9FLAO